MPLMASPRSITACSCSFTTSGRALHRSKPNAALIVRACINFGPIFGTKYLDQRLTSGEAILPIAPGTRPPDASLRTRGSIEGERPTIMGLPIGAALWAASRAAPAALSSSVREPSEPFRAPDSYAPRASPEAA